jgi:hypothetical protein
LPWRHFITKIQRITGAAVGGERFRQPRAVRAVGGRGAVSGGGCGEVS